MKTREGFLALVSATLQIRCANPEVQAVRVMPVDHVDLSTIADGDFVVGEYVCHDIPLGE